MSVLSFEDYPYVDHTDWVPRTVGPAVGSAPTKYERYPSHLFPVEGVMPVMGGTVLRATPYRIELSVYLHLHCGGVQRGGLGSSSSSSSFFLSTSGQYIRLTRL